MRSVVHQFIGFGMEAGQRAFDDAMGKGSFAGQRAP
jgi:hypothetical protein